MPKKYKYLIHSKEQNMYIKWQVHFEIHVLSSLLTGRQVCIKWQFIILISFWFSTGIIVYSLSSSFIRLYRESLAFAAEPVAGSLANYLEKFDRSCTELSNTVSVNPLDELRLWRAEEFDTKLLHACIERLFMLYR